jgi:hypothetical protein
MLSEAEEDHQRTIPRTAIEQPQSDASRVLRIH